LRSSCVVDNIPGTSRGRSDREWDPAVNGVSAGPRVDCCALQIYSEVRTDAHPLALIPCLPLVLAASLVAMAESMVEVGYRAATQRH